MNNYFQTITIMVLGLALGCQPDKPAENSGPKVPLPNAGGSVEFDTDAMVWLDGGSFQMGFATGQLDEQPVHQVKVDGFWIGKHEVTNAEFEAFAKDSGYKTIAERKPKPEDFPEIPPAEFSGIKEGSIVFMPPNEDIPLEMLKNHNAFLAWWK